MEELTSMKFGYNIASNQQAVSPAILAASNAPYHVVMTAPPNGVSDANALNEIDTWSGHFGAERIVWRTYNAHEGNWTQYESPATYVSRWKAEGRREIIRDDPCNEPNIGDDFRYVARSVALLDRAADAGFRVAIGAFSVGTPHHEAIQRGVYDPLLQAIARGNHFLSYHSYGHGIPDIGERRGIQELQTPLSAGSGMIRKRWEIGAGYWYLRRTDWFVLRARQLGLPDTPTIMTESWVDQINSHPALQDALRKQYGLPEYNHDLRGIQSWSKYLSAAFPEQSWLQINRTLLEYLRDYVYYPDYIKGVCLFAINPLWERPQGHNWGAESMRRVLVDVIPAVNRAIAPQPQPEPQPEDFKRGRIIVKNNLNMRAAPTTKAHSIRMLSAGTYDVDYLPSATEADGYEWTRMKIGEQLGYVANLFEWTDDKPDVSAIIEQLESVLAELRRL